MRGNPVFSSGIERESERVSEKMLPGLAGLLSDGLGGYIFSESLLHRCLCSAPLPRAINDRASNDPLSACNSVLTVCFKYISIIVYTHSLFHVSLPVR